MTIEYAALAIGAFLIVVILIWRKLRFMDARLRKMQKELKEFQILYSRLFMTTMNANPKVEAAFVAEPQNAETKSNGDEGHKSNAEVIPLVPPSNPVGAGKQTPGPSIVR